MTAKARTFLLSATAALLLGAAPAADADVLIRGGTIYTGLDAPFTGDVAVKGNRIVAVGRNLRILARRTIAAKGMVVAPGFIDPHTHADKMLVADDTRERLVLPFLTQGVTTAFIGNDGEGSPEIAATLNSAASKKVGINYASFVGFGAVRKRIMGMAARAPNAAELEKMKALVDGAMCQGALGLSTGLFYAPQSFSKTNEVVALARAAARRGGLYDSHIRDESTYSVGLEAAIDEAMMIGLEAGLPVHISHIKALGVDVQGKSAAIIAAVERARAKGQNVTANQYPWEASGTTLGAALLPSWAQAGGRAQLLARLADTALHARLVREMTENLRKRGGAAKLLIVAGPNSGRTLADLTGQGDAVATAIHELRQGDPGVVSFNQSERDIEAFMKRPWVVTGSDASPGHPRTYGSFARKYAEYVVARRTISLRDFIERSSRVTADIFGLADRGRLRPGAFADIVIFDPRHYAARATYADPTLLATGVNWVFVNGVAAIENGKVTGVAAGAALPRQVKGQCR